VALALRASLRPAVLASCAGPGEQCVRTAWAEADAVRVALLAGWPDRSGLALHDFVGLPEVGCRKSRL